MSQYITHTLPNGLRIIHLPSPSPVVYCGYAIGAGTRDEQPGDEGLAHFCEHVTFKGTRRRSAMQILNCLESVGGELNAFTNKESTVFYSAVMKEHTSRAADLLTDIVFGSVYPQHEIDKEIAVICDEIESYNDAPSELIFDEFENIIFSGHPLGHNILGNVERLRTYTTADALRFTRRHYRPDNAVFFVYGDTDTGRLIRRLSQLTPDRPATPAGSPPATAVAADDAAGNVYVRRRGTHQAHVVTGCRGMNAYDERRTVLFLLNNIIGGTGMNARLNISLRERNGLVYTVESTSVNYRDTGLWAVYFGCDHGDIRKCLRLVRRELDRMTDRPLGEAQTARAKKQIKGQIAIAVDNRESFALSFAREYLLYGKCKDISRLFRRIDDITPEQIQDTARRIFDPEGMTTLIYTD